MSLNHVEPFHFATQLLTAWKDLVQTLHLPRQSLQTAARLQIPPPAESKAQGIQRYCMQNLNVSIYVSLAPGGMLRFRVPLCSAGTTG